MLLPAAAPPLAAGLHELPAAGVDARCSARLTSRVPRFSRPAAADRRPASAVAWPACAARRRLDASGAVAGGAGRAAVAA